MQAGWELEMLEDLARAITYPATPDLERAVRSRLGTARRARAFPSWRLAMGGLAAAAVAVGVVLMASKDVRDAVADFLGLAVEGERIEGCRPRQQGRQRRHSRRQCRSTGSRGR
jgi:hypothetical protein